MGGWVSTSGYRLCLIHDGVGRPCCGQRALRRGWRAATHIVLLLRRGALRLAVLPNGRESVDRLVVRLHVAWRASALAAPAVVAMAVTAEAQATNTGTKKDGELVTGGVAQNSMDMGACRGPLRHVPWLLLVRSSGEEPHRCARVDPSRLGLRETTNHTLNCIKISSVWRSYLRAREAISLVHSIY